MGKACGRERQYQQGSETRIKCHPGNQPFHKRLDAQPPAWESLYLSTGYGLQSSRQPDPIQSFYRKFPASAPNPTEQQCRPEYVRTAIDPLIQLRQIPSMMIEGENVIPRNRNRKLTRRLLQIFWL